MLRFLVLLLYNVLYAPALLIMAPAALRKMKARGGKAADLKQRFGRFDDQTKAALAAIRARGDVWWMHAVSVGEIGVAARLIKELMSRRHDLGIVLSTTTPTGFAEAGKVAAKYPGRVLAIYNPVDLWFVVRRCLDAVSPRRLLLVEAEVWPNLVFAASRRGIPVSLVNARLSPRSERRYGWFLPLVRPVFAMLAHVGVPESGDVERWQTLGASRDRTSVTGNIKYDTAGQSEPAGQIAQLAEVLRRAEWPVDAPVLLAASTHAGEEVGIAKVWLELRKTLPELRFIIVPRHAERAESVQHDLLEIGLNSLRRSAVEAKRTDVLLVDTTGELRAWQHLATVVVVGKSFLGKGGQNPAEAIIAGRPVAFGPHMENFELLVRQLLAARGAVQVPGLELLGPALTRLLRDPPLRAAMTEEGRKVLRCHEGAAARTCEFLG